MELGEASKPAREVAADRMRAAPRQRPEDEQGTLSAAAGTGRRSSQGELGGPEPPAPPVHALGGPKNASQQGLGGRGARADGLHLGGLARVALLPAATEGAMRGVTKKEAKEVRPH